MTPTRLLARTVRGIETIAAEEIRAVGEVERIGHREVLFTCPTEAAALALRCVDDVFRVIATIDGIGHTRAALRLLSKAAAAVDPPPTGRASTIDVTASFLGRRNYTRYDLEDAVGEPLAAVTGLRYHSRRGGTAPPPGGLSWRLTVTGDQALLALRLADRPLHRRPYRTVTRPGSLHPPLAAAMLRLAGPLTGRRLLDPCCGAGTIPLEASTMDTMAHAPHAVPNTPASTATTAANGHDSRAAANDHAPRAVANRPATAADAVPVAHDSCAVADRPATAADAVPVPHHPRVVATGHAPRPIANGPASAVDVVPVDHPARVVNPVDHTPAIVANRPFLTIAVDHDPLAVAAAVANGLTDAVVADAGRLPLGDASVDIVVSNPPWNRQVPPTGRLTHHFWHELRRVLRPGGRAVLLLPPATPTGLPVISRHPVTLSGAHPEIVVMELSTPVDNPGDNSNACA